MAASKLPYCCSKGSNNVWDWFHHGWLETRINWRTDSPQIEHSVLKNNKNRSTGCETAYFCWGEFVQISWQVYPSLQWSMLSHTFFYIHKCSNTFTTFSFLTHTVFLLLFQLWAYFFRNYTTKDGTKSPKQNLKLFSKQRRSSRTLKMVLMLFIAPLCSH